MTDELNVSHWFKRLTAAQLMFGDSDTHLQRYAALSTAASRRDDAWPAVGERVKAVVAREIGKPPWLNKSKSKRLVTVR